MAARKHKVARKTSRKPSRKTSLSAIHVHARPQLRPRASGPKAWRTQAWRTQAWRTQAWRTQAWLLAGQHAIRAALGRAGIKAAKREGDGATPAGQFRPVRLWWRADRLPRPRTLLPVRPIAPHDAWCEDPKDRRYNRPFRRSANEPGDRLQRADGLYDLIVEIDHNTRPRVAGFGSAVFIHVARPGFAPTAGCVALTRADLQRLVSRLSPKTRIIVHS